MKCGMELSLCVYVCVYVCEACVRHVCVVCTVCVVLVLLLCIIVYYFMGMYECIYAFVLYCIIIL